jgi:hypothetical protein
LQPSERVNYPRRTSERHGRTDTQNNRAASISSQLKWDQTNRRAALLDHIKSFQTEKAMNMLRRMFVISLAAVGAFASVALAADANVSGTWNMTVESPMGTGNPTFTLTQKGADVTGTYKGQLGEAPVTGTVKGNAVELKYTIDAQGTQLAITYAGTVEGGEMKGKVSYGDMGEGTFTGKKG